MEFLTDLDMRALPARRSWWFFKRRQRQILRPFVARLQPEFDLPDCYIPTNFVCDLASIPLVVLGLLDADSEKAAVLHDHGCRFGWLPVFIDGRVTYSYPDPKKYPASVNDPPPFGFEKFDVSRRTIDLIFKQGLAVSGVSTPRQHLMYAGVRAGALL